MTANTNPLFPLVLTILNSKEEEHDIHYQVGLPEPTACESCGVIGKLTKYGKQDQSYRDLPIRNKRVTIWVVRQRYRCDECKATFRPLLKEMDERRMMTKRLANHIQTACMNTTNTEVAETVGVDEKTVRAIFMEFYKEQDKLYRPQTPTVLGIDELYLGKAYRCIFTNITQSTVIEMLKDRFKATVTNFLLHLPDRHTVKVVCMDMWPSYRDAVKTALPQAIIVVDKFHVTRMANEALETVRKGLKESLTAAQRRTLKGDRKLLLLRESTLSGWQVITMQTWLNQFPELNSAYRAKEDFYGIWEATSEADARQRYAAWRASIPDAQSEAWKPIFSAFKNWDREIFNYFRTGNQFTNAFTESINRQVKDRQRDTRGMKFETYRAKVLFGQAHKIVKPKPRKASPFEGFSRMPPGYFEEGQPIDFGVPLSTVLHLLETGEL